jgi:glutathione S-transferase
VLPGASERRAPRPGEWVVWGSELSPFTLKVIRLLRHAQLPFRFLPVQGSWSDNVRHALRVEALKRRLRPLTWPVMTADDEFPLVPFLVGPAGESLYDSSAIAEWLDRSLPADQRVIPEDPAAAFVARLVDDYADEFGLYLVHHNRWKFSALDNDAGARVAHEFRFTAGPAQKWFARWFAARQTRRLPYLFSVAPAGFRIDGLSPARQPPAIDGFPSTHALLEEAFTRLLDILEALLAHRPYVLGPRFTLADASLYGQLGMNLSDPGANRLMATRAPRLHRWLQRLHGTEPSALVPDADLRLDSSLRPLLTEIGRTHVALMRSNAAAVAELRGRGRRRFNEAAFDRGEALYTGAIDGQPFVSVAKTFQARVWRDCCARWAALGEADRARLRDLLPAEIDFT